MPAQSKSTDNPMFYVISMCGCSDQKTLYSSWSVNEAVHAFYKETGYSNECAMVELGYYDNTRWVVLKSN